MTTIITDSLIIAYYFLDFTVMALAGHTACTAASSTGRTALLSVGDKAPNA